MRSNLASFLVVAFSGVGLAACGSVASQDDGGSGHDGAADTAPPTADEACNQFASTFCARLGGCAPLVLQILYGDSTTCESRVVLGCTRDLAVPDSNETTTDMVACARDAANATCDDLIANNLPASCQTKPGDRLNGEGCGSSWQCMSTHCEKTTGDCGVCAPRASSGGACTVNESCAASLVCAAQKCVAPGALNAPCNDKAPCLGNLYCSATTNLCAMPLARGASCAGDTGGCDFKQGLACNSLSAAPKCEMIAAAKGGEACGIVNGTLTVCIEGTTCPGLSLIPLQTMGVCPNPAGDGEQCSDSARCLPPASCAGGLCRLPSSASCMK